MSAAAICVDDFARVAFAKRFARFIRKPRTVVCRSVPHVSFGSRNVKAARKGKRQPLASPTTAGDAAWQQREKTKGSLLRDCLKCIANFNLLNKVKKKVSFFVPRISTRFVRAKIRNLGILSFCLRDWLSPCTFGPQLNGCLQNAIPLQSSPRAWQPSERPDTRNLRVLLLR